MKKDLTILTIAIVALVLIVYILAPHKSVIPVETQTPSPETTENQNPVPVPEEPSEGFLTAKMNNSANGFGVTIAPIEVVEDSRCPVDENIRCIQAGTVRLRTKITNTNGERALIITLGQSIASKTETIIFTQVLPPARAAVPIRANEYRFTFKVSKNVQR